MSINQSGLRRTVGRNEGDIVSGRIRSADLIAGAFFLGLNIIAALGDMTSIFIKFGRVNGGIVFLYKTFCYPVAFIVSRFFSLRGDVLYVWLVAQLVFILTTFLLWLILILTTALFRILKV